ncbi:LysR family transcriptional regulator [Glutamicibacter uratoxydans]|uniref:LysR family transcriptional regulator n=1 Tax=Glutamicibacter uratoxydans TaxID=43667 RepID=UPI003D6EE440
MELSKVDLNLLVPLRALLEEANVTRAGERINMGQSSMSSALSRLRATFDDELLVRTGRDYELTPMARLLLPQVQVTLPLIEHALGSGEPFDPRTSTRHYRLLMSDFAMLELKARLAELLAVGTNIRLEILPLPSNPTDSDHAMTVNDFVVAVPGIGIDGEACELFSDEYVCLMDARNPYAAQGAITWDQFSQLPYAVCDFGSNHLTPPERRMREMGLVREPRISTASFLSLPQVVAGTDLVAVVPRRLAERLTASTGTVALPVPFERVELISTLFWHPAHNSDPSHGWLRHSLQFRDRPVPTRWPLDREPRVAH